jgi:hypothetical protein
MARETAPLFTNAPRKAQVNLSPDNLHKIKIIEFNKAMKKYNAHYFYHKSGFFISSLIVGLQFLTVVNLSQTVSSATLLGSFLSFICAYIITDFINGLVHMFMDNNTHYSSFMGPFIASFHLHHKSPLYKNRHPIKIYFLESGSKFWLVFYLLILVLCQIYLSLPFYVNLFFVSMGVLSSVAEVSHYFCHNSREEQTVISKLQRYRILLSKSHHANHHALDNTHYAFLNGVTNPIINKIAHYFYEGYKNNSDRHVISYVSKQTDNR